MTTTITTEPKARGAAAPPRYTRRSLLRVYRTEAWQEFLKLIRLPIFAVTTIALPLMFYVIFGITFAGEQARGVGMTTYMLVTYGAFGVIGAALFGFGVSVAVERGQGWMRLKRVAPMPPLAYFVGKVVMSLAVATIVLAMFTLGALVGGVRLDPQQWVALGSPRVRCRSRRWAGVRLPCPNSAPAVLNLAWLPMAFASGLWIPISQLPDVVQSIAVALPPYHLQARAGHHRGVRGRLAGRACRRNAGIHAVVPGRGSWGFRRDEGRTYG